MDITQSSNRAILDWNSLNIGSSAQVNFVQPSPAAVALNRVVGQDPSQILGRLTANGQVFLVNPNGIYFGRNAQVDVAGLVATTHNIKNAVQQKTAVARSLRDRVHHQLLFISKLVRIGKSILYGGELRRCFTLFDPSLSH